MQPLEDSLSNLTERGSEVLNRLAAADERQAHAVSEVEARLSEWHATERRLHQDSLDRIRTLERTIEHEWRALRGMHEEPLRLLREQATALGETSVAAASLSLRGYERAEARLSALETDLRAQLTQLSRDIHAALAEVKAATMGAPAALPPPAAAPFPLDRVLRIHDGLRESGSQAPVASSVSTSTASAVPVPATAPQRDEMRQLPAASALSQRVDDLERELTQERQDIEDTAASAKRLRRDWRVAVAAAIVGVVALGALGLQLQRALNEASLRATAAEQQAAEADRRDRGRARGNRRGARCRGPRRTAQFRARGAGPPALRDGRRRPIERVARTGHVESLERPRVQRVHAAARAGRSRVPRLAAHARSAGVRGQDLARRRGARHARCRFPRCAAASGRRGSDTGGGRVHQPGSGRPHGPRARASGGAMTQAPPCR